MSKMGRLFLELTEQAQELGYESIEDAERHGYEVFNNKLYMTAEKALQDEKDEQLNKLDEVIAYIRDEISDGIADIEKKNTAYELLEKLADVEKYIKERS